MGMLAKTVVNCAASVGFVGSVGCIDNEFHERLDTIPHVDAGRLPAEFVPVAPSCENTAPTEHVFEITFEGIEPGCEWGVDGNLEPVDGLLNARVQQTRTVELNAFNEICGISFDFDPDQTGQTLTYDDELFFTMNDIVMLASDETQVARLEEMDGFYFYDWDVLAGTPIDFSPSIPPYCVGEAEGLSTCTMPAAHYEGEVSLSLGAPLVRDLGELIIEDQTLDFTMIAVGDNDPTDDCTYSSWDFNVTIHAI